jgi:hypothetical protein
LKNFLFIFPFKKLIYKNFSAFSAKVKMASAERKDFWLRFYATANKSPHAIKPPNNTFFQLKNSKFEPK